ncbi:hypothetical protein [Urbifossiella limnaea]|uniref:Lipoprotein n=1 Tax=Urbifossiella limnaea TaxID=2528023 RepID=A0A517XV74_9BACT|nr:hypothetical protein [Urbifossiella limnaea]QDU21412.1 hypothetical protein ETAA1_33790 [Urbifossiella limnaea]
MDRRAAIGFACGLLLLSGCVHSGTFSVEKLLGWEDPATANTLPVSLPTSERVDSLGRRIMAQNPFSGLEPLFHVVWVRESVLFHRGTSEVFISAGLVETCKTEPELAAVLCSELGKMSAEKRRASQFGKDREGISSVTLPDATTFDPSLAAEVGHKEAVGTKRFTPAELNAEAVARDLLRGTGFDPAELDKVQPLLRQSQRGDDIRKQMAGSAAAPKWER